MTFTEAAAEVLRLVGKPLHYKKITEIAIEKNLLSHVGKTPEVTMSSRLATMVKKDRGDSIIIKVKPGVFGLRDFGEDVLKSAESEPGDEEDVEIPAIEGEEEGEEAGREAGLAPATNGGAEAAPAPAPAPKKESKPLPGQEMFPEEEDDDEPILGGGKDKDEEGEGAGEGGERGRGGRRRRRRRRGGGRGDGPATTPNGANAGAADASGEDDGLGDDDGLGRDDDVRAADESRGAEPRHDRGDRGGRSRGAEARHADPRNEDLRERELPEAVDGDLVGKELADAVWLVLSRGDRQPTGLMRIAELLVRKGRLQGEPSLLLPTIAASVRADTSRRGAEGERPRFRIQQGGRVALLDWALPSEALRFEQDAYRAADRQRYEVRRAFLRRIQELPAAGFAELLATWLNAEGVVSLRAIRRPNTPPGELHLAGTLRRGLDETRLAIVARRDGRDLGRERVIELRGSLFHYGNANAAWLVTTGQALSGAREEAAVPGGAPFVLLDGIGLAKAMEKVGVGLRRYTIPVAAIDVDLLEALRGEGAREERPREERGGRDRGRDDRGGRDRGRDDRPRDDRPREARGRDRNRDDRPRDDAPREGRGRDRTRDDRPRDDAGREAAPREDRPRNDRSREGGRGFERATGDTRLVGAEELPGEDSMDGEDVVNNEMLATSPRPGNETLPPPVADVIEPFVTLVEEGDERPARMADVFDDDSDVADVNDDDADEDDVQDLQDEGDNDNDNDNDRDEDR